MEERYGTQAETLFGYAAEKSYQDTGLCPRQLCCAGGRQAKGMSKIQQFMCKINDIRRTTLKITAACTKRSLRLLNCE